MKTLGLIGGISWFSTALYYRTINELTNERLGGAHAARLLLYSVDFNDVKMLQEAGDWAQLEIMISGIAKRLEQAGADCIVICANTPHLVADTVRQKIEIPLLHIVEETAKEVTGQKIGNVGLLGTKFTMEHSFFRDGLTNFGIPSVIPGDADRNFIHGSIINELTKGVFNEQTKIKYLDIIKKLQQAGAQAVIFGCTEIAMLIHQIDCEIPVFDTAAIHARAAVDFALGSS